MQPHKGRKATGERAAGLTALPSHVQRAIAEAEAMQSRSNVVGAYGATDIKRQQRIGGNDLRVRPANLGPIRVEMSPPIALGTMVAPKFRSDLERRYVDEVLEPERLAGEILWWLYEPITLHIGGGVKYKPDFGVLPTSREFRFDETKGFWREAARARIKLAASIFPFKFQAIQWDKDTGWKVERF